MSEVKKAGIVHYLVDGWLVILLAILFGGTLAGVDIAWRDRILANRKQKMLRAIARIFPQSDLKRSREVKITGPEGKKLTVWQVNDQANHCLGWGILTSGQGFNGEIQLLLALDAKAEKIVDIDILAQSETPALGDQITNQDSPLRQSYRKGLSASRPVVVVKRQANVKDNEVEALSGATISSESVTAIVNVALDKYRPGIQKLISNPTSK
ncbi:MAG: FMN-binding protein [Lentisphaerae bacterium]|nr:MAG: FMN-binding protein [Lentisphaerota bacterium]